MQSKSDHYTFLTLLFEEETEALERQDIFLGTQRIGSQSWHHIRQLMASVMCFLPWLCEACWGAASPLLFWCNLK